MTRTKAKAERPAKCVVRSTLPDGVCHRPDLEHCPNCEHRMAPEDWEKAATVFVTGEVHGKHGSGAVATECPSCFKLSWVHMRLDVFQYSEFPDKVHVAMAAELRRRQLGALRDAGRGLCFRCAKLRGGNVTTNAWRECDIGSGPVTDDCDKFVEAKS